MLRTLLALLVASLFAVVGVSSLAAQTTPKNALLLVEAEGRPPRSDQRLDRPRFFLWHDADGWHLHTRTAGKSREFSGTIKVAGGKIYELRNVGGLERKKDVGHINSTGNEVKFRFRTAEHGDGIDFKVSADVTRLEFELNVGGYGHPNAVEIGAKSQHPPASIFTIVVKEKPE